VELAGRLWRRLAAELARLATGPPLRLTLRATPSHCSHPRHHPPPRPTSIFLCPVAPAALAVRLWGPPEGKGRKRGGEAARAAGEASIFRFISLVSVRFFCSSPITC
jgi:hypothetical protein